MTPYEEAVFEQKAEKELAGHRGLQNGRDFRWNVFRYRDEQTQDFKSRYEKTFPMSPGSPLWFYAKFGCKGQRKENNSPSGYYPGGSYFGRREVNNRGWEVTRKELEQCQENQ